MKHEFQKVNTQRNSHRKWHKSNQFNEIVSINISNNKQEKQLQSTS